MRNRNQKGFTLIELLIVIAIIGILAAVLIPNLLAARTRAFNTASQSCARSIATAQEIEQIDNQAYVATVAAIGDQAMIDGCLDGDITVTVGVYADDTWTVTHAQGNVVYTVGPAGITNP